MRTTTRTRSLLAGAALAAALITGGCAGGGSENDAGSHAEPAAGEAAPDVAMDRAEGADGGGVAGGAADAADPASVTSSVGGSRREPVKPAEQAIIATGTVSLEAEDVGDARFEVQKIASQVGGSITQEETSTEDDGDLERARIVLRVPSGQFSATTAALEKVGRLTSSTTESEDVTTQVIDVEARVRSQERSVRRIETLLAQAATLREIVSIESELSQRQADLDSLKSQQKYLQDQTSLSTITVFLEQPGKNDEDDERGGFLGGLANGWDAFVSGLSGAVTVLGYLLPWLALLALVGGPAWFWLRSRRGRRPVPASQP